MTLMDMTQRLKSTPFFLLAWVAPQYYSATTVRDITESEIKRTNSPLWHLERLLGNNDHNLNDITFISIDNVICKYADTGCYLSDCTGELKVNPYSKWGLRDPEKRKLVMEGPLALFDVLIAYDWRDNMFCLRDYGVRGPPIPKRMNSSLLEQLALSPA